MTGQPTAQEGEGDGLSPEQGPALRGAVLMLSPAERRMLSLSRLHGRSHAQIAGELGMTEQAVHETLLSILKRLAKRMPQSA